MLGLSRCERCFVIALPVAFLSAALLLLLCSTAWSIYGRPMATCYPPAQFTSEQSAYGMQVCSSGGAGLYQPPSRLVPSRENEQVRKITDEVLAPARWAAKVPFRLLWSTIILALPLLLADVMAGVAEAVAPSKRPLTRVGTAFRPIFMLLTRVALLTCLFVGLNEVRMDAPKVEAGMDSRRDPMLGMTVLCDYEIRRLGNLHRFTLMCHISDGPHVMLAKTLVRFLWYSLALVAAWVALSTAALVVLVACPATRSSALRDARKTTESLDAED